MKEEYPCLILIIDKINPDETQNREEILLSKKLINDIKIKINYE
jgi:hypothetical protein